MLAAWAPSIDLSTQLQDQQEAPHHLLPLGSKAGEEVH